MTKLSISLAAAMLSITFAPAVNAYGVEPGPQSSANLTQIATSTPQTADVAGACTVNITPVLATVLGLSADWRGDRVQPQQTSIACAEE